jgi:hypothetical protein
MHMLNREKWTLTFVLMVFIFSVGLIFINSNSVVSKTIEFQCGFMNAPFTVELTLTQRLFVDKESICPTLEAILSQIYGETADLRNSSLSTIRDSLKGIIN